MKKLLFILIASLTLTVAHGQLYPVKNLKYQQSWSWANCPDANCFWLSWSKPNISSTDTLLGYKIYQNDVFYKFLIDTTYGCWYPLQSSGCSDTTPKWYTFLPPHHGQPFWVTVKAVYNKDSTTSIANDSAQVGGAVISVQELSEKKYFTIVSNPFSLQTTFNVNKNLQNATLIVYNSFGQEVKQVKNIFGQSIIFQRGNLPSGLYFIRLSQDSKIFATDKLVITDN